ncbi:MAG TPA: MarR family transcriptional regulator [Caldilineae bacterium]|nr:MarR family transcriptional regulator [Caldilineae bacterium]
MPEAQASNPLVRVLQAITHGGPRSTSDLARELGVSKETLRRMLTTLASRGYIRRNVSTCESRCNQCSLRRTCFTSDTSFWLLSEKGREAIAKERE